MRDKSHIQQPDNNSRQPQQQGQRPVQPHPKSRLPRLRLPFENRNVDAGTWSYDHRVGICITLIVYLVIAILFVWWKIEVGTQQGIAHILVDMQEQEQMREELTPEEIEILKQQMLDDFRDVRNQVSNENADLNSQLQDSKGINASELYNDANSLDDKLRANREAYEEGLKQQDAIEKKPTSGSEDGDKKQDTKVEGRVTVSFSFTNPVRTSQNLIIPAYKCEGGGQVVVIATLDINGYVNSASIDKSSSTNDDCMLNAALNAARNSRFNIDNTAPAKHKGTITYMFIPQ